MRILTDKAEEAKYGHDYKTCIRSGVMNMYEF